MCAQDCSHGAKCVTFVCPLVDMNRSATVSVRARLWNATLMEVQGLTASPADQATALSANVYLSKRRACVCVFVCVFQDYSDASSVTVRGRASLKLQTNKPSISMETRSTEVPRCPLQAATLITASDESFPWCPVLLPVAVVHLVTVFVLRSLSSSYIQRQDCGWSGAPPCGSWCCPSWPDCCCWLSSASCCGR